MPMRRTAAVLLLVITLAGCSDDKPAAQPAAPPTSEAPSPTPSATPSPTPSAVPSAVAADPVGAALCATVKPLWGTAATLDPKQLLTAAASGTGTTNIALGTPALVLRMAAQDAVDHPGDPTRQATLHQRVDEAGQACLRDGYYANP